jgi:hypothetical protein
MRSLSLAACCSSCASLVGAQLHGQRWRAAVADVVDAALQTGSWHPGASTDPAAGATGAFCLLFCILPSADTMYCVDVLQRWMRTCSCATTRLSKRRPTRSWHAR